MGNQKPEEVKDAKKKELSEEDLKKVNGGVAHKEQEQPGSEMNH
jgi:bacteriocin-like protein